MIKLVIPKFATEREEADWWYSQRDVISANFLEATRNGTIQRDVMKRIAEQRAAKKRAPAKSN